MEKLSKRSQNTCQNSTKWTNHLSKWPRPTNPQNTLNCQSRQQLSKEPKLSKCQNFSNGGNCQNGKMTKTVKMVQ